MLDADLRDFFTSLDQSWLLRFLEHRIADKRVLRLIQKWLKAGVVENGAWSETVEGTPQGALVSTFLANVYLHHVFDLWVQQWRGRHAHGDVIVVRFAEDFVMGFQRREDAVRFQKDLRRQFAEFGLELNAEKTHLIQFGRFAASTRKERGLGKPETFEFLGFTHICTKSKNGWFKLQRITSKSGCGQNYARSRPSWCTAGIRNGRGELFTSFIPAVSDDAAKTIRRTIRSWRIHLWSGTSLTEIAREINLIVRGWVNYYGRFYPTRLAESLRRIDEYLVCWAMWKYKRLKGHRKRTWEFLAGVFAREPELFAHWRVVRANDRTVGAV